jgi:hypothetical protein
MTISTFMTVSFGSSQLNEAPPGIAMKKLRRISSLRAVAE